jgi:hypothetical protein
MQRRLRIQRDPDDRLRNHAFFALALTRPDKFRATNAHESAAAKSCHTGFVLKKLTITVSEEVAAWVREKAAEDNTSVSKLIGQMLENQMKMSDEYWRAYRRWKKDHSLPGVNAANRLSREEAHKRRR